MFTWRMVVKTEVLMVLVEQSCHQPSLKRSVAVNMLVYPSYQAATNLAAALQYRCDNGA